MTGVTHAYPASGVRHPARIPAQLGRLLIIDIRQSRSLLFLAALVIAALLVVRDSLTPGVVLWSDISIAGARAMWIIGPASAGFSAWLAARGRRSSADVELATPVSLPDWVPDASRLLAALYWSLLAYFVVLAPISGWGAWHATWGGPWLDLWLAVGCVIVASVTGGFVIGRFWRSRIAPLIAVVVAFVMPSLVLRPVEPLSVQSVAMWRVEHLWTTGGWSVAPIMAVFWLSGAALCVALWLVLRHPAKLALGMLVLTAGLAIVAGTFANRSFNSATAAGAQREGRAPTLRQAVPMHCTRVHATEICVHQAWRGVEDDLIADLDPALRVFGGLPGVPGRFVQYNEYAAWDMPFSHFQYRSPAWDGPAAYLQIVDAVFPAAGVGIAPQAPGRFTAAQLAILAAINPERVPQVGSANAPLDVMPDGVAVSSVPRELVDDQAAPGFASMGSDSPGAAMNAEMRAAAERFAALSPEEQRAWLDANWDALRSGELTLDDLP